MSVPYGEWGFNPIQHPDEEFPSHWGTIGGTVPISGASNVRPDDILRQCNNWRDFKRRLRTASKKEKGDCFEALKLCYLKLDYKYQKLLKNVWIPLRTAPREVLEKVGLERQDEGIDD